MPSPIKIRSDYSAPQLRVLAKSAKTNSPSARWASNPRLQIAGCSGCVSWSASTGNSAMSSASFVWRGFRR